MSLPLATPPQGPGHLGRFPFAAAPFTPNQIDALSRHLDEWSSAFQLGDARFRHVAQTYVQYCSPPEPTPAGIELDAAYMSLYFAFNDTVGGASLVDTLRLARRALSPDQRRVPNAEWEHARASPRHLAAIAGFIATATRCFPGKDCRPLLLYVEQLLASFCWEAELAGVLPPTDEYLRHRIHTVGAYPHFEIWRLAMNADVPASVQPWISATETLSARVIHTTNDILSVQRDQRKQKLNLVFFLQRDRGLSLGQATAAAVAMLEEHLADFQRSHEAAKAAVPAGSRVSMYLDYLAAAIEGNRLATLALTERFLGAD